MARRALLALWIYLLPLVAPWAILLAVNASDPATPLLRSSLPQQPHRPDACTWDCHNHGCRHRPRLPPLLTSDQGLFGATIRGLYRAGGALSSDRSRGYGAANLLLLCAAWPALMYALWVIVWRQRLALRSLRSLRASSASSASRPSRSGP